MAQTSTTLSGEKTHKADVTGTDIAFNATGSVYKITSTETTLNNFEVRDLITVTGSANNNATFTVKARDFPGADFLQTSDGTASRTATSPVEQFTDKLDYRIRGRSFAIRLASSALGCKFKMGTPRVDIREDGRR